MLIDGKKFTEIQDNNKSVVTFKRPAFENLKLLIDSFETGVIHDISFDDNVVHKMYTDTMSFLKDKDGYTLSFILTDAPQSEIDLAKQKAEAEAVSHFIALGLQNAEIKDVIKWSKFLDDWNAFKFPYKKGERFKYKSIPYEVIEAVISSETNTPDKDSQHYKLLQASENSQDKPKVEIKLWDEKHTYNKGDLVIARGIVFVSKIDNNKGNEPGFGSTWDYYKEK
nr:MAG TPA: CBD-like protein [Bacteriophage sp.]